MDGNQLYTNETFSLPEGTHFECSKDASIQLFLPSGEQKILYPGVAYKREKGRFYENREGQWYESANFTQDHAQNKFNPPSSLEWRIHFGKFSVMKAKSGTSGFQAGDVIRADKGETVILNEKSGSRIAFLPGSVAEVGENGFFLGTGGIRLYNQKNRLEIVTPTSVVGLENGDIEIETGPGGDSLRVLEGNARIESRLDSRVEWLSSGQEAQNFENLIRGKMKTQKSRFPELEIPDISGRLTSSSFSREKFLSASVSAQAVETSQGGEEVKDLAAIAGENWKVKTQMDELLQPAKDPKWTEDARFRQNRQREGIQRKIDLMSERALRGQAPAGNEVIIDLRTQKRILDERRRQGIFR